jgi:hypothetical protein
MAGFIGRVRHHHRVSETLLLLPVRRLRSLRSMNGRKRETERERERENTYEISSTAFLQDSATEEDAERCDPDACWFLALDCDSLQCAIAP